MKTIGYTYWQNNFIYYVSDLLGNGHPKKDPSGWGYHTDPLKAIHLSKYWQRRFKHDMEFAGRKAFFQDEIEFADRSKEF